MAAAFLLVFICLPFTVLSLLAALPAMVLVLLADRVSSGYWSVDFREAFVATAMSMFVYLVVTIFIGVIVCVFREELSGLGGLGTVSEAMFGYRGRVMYEAASAPIVFITLTSELAVAARSANYVKPTRQLAHTFHREPYFLFAM